MAQFCEIDIVALEAWAATRPAMIQDLIRRFQPHCLFRFKEGARQRCYVHSYNEDGTLTVIVSGQFNRVLFGRLVFGIQPEDLEPSELPLPDEDVGDTSAEAGLTTDNIIDVLNQKLRKLQTDPDRP